MNEILDLSRLTDGQLYRLHERVRHEGERRGWGEYWQESGTSHEIYADARRLEARERA